MKITVPQIKPCKSDESIVDLNETHININTTDAVAQKVNKFFTSIRTSVISINTIAINPKNEINSTHRREKSMVLLNNSIGESRNNIEYKFWECKKYKQN